MQLTYYLLHFTISKRRAQAKYVLYRYFKWISRRKLIVCNLFPMCWSQNISWQHFVCLKKNRIQIFIIISLPPASLECICTIIFTNMRQSNWNNRLMVIIWKYTPILFSSQTLADKSNDVVNSVAPYPLCNFSFLVKGSSSHQFGIRMQHCNNMSATTPPPATSFTRRRCANRIYEIK